MITPAEIAQYQSPAFDAPFAAAHQAGQIAWYPWVGKQYPSSSCKVLVVLESHYINWERTNEQAIKLPDFTRLTFATLLFPQHCWTSDTFPPLTECLSGQNLSVDKRHLLWEKVALYNFVQRPMDNPEARPNARDFATGWKAFASVVDILRPDVCIFAGFAAISHLNKLPPGLEISGTTPWEPEEINGAYPRPCFTICTPNITLKGVAIKHPGSYFSADKWRAVLTRQVPQAMKTLVL